MSEQKRTRDEMIALAKIHRPATWAAIEEAREYLDELDRKYPKTSRVDDEPKGFWSKLFGG